MSREFPNLARALGGWGKGKNSFSHSVRSAGASEGGGVGGIPPRPSKNRSRTRRLLVQSRTPKKSFVFLLEEKMVARKSKPQTKLFFGGASVSERRRGACLPRAGLPLVRNFC